MGAARERLLESHPQTDIQFRFAVGLLHTVARKSIITFRSFELVERIQTQADFPADWLSPAAARVADQRAMERPIRKSPGTKDLHRGSASPILRSEDGSRAGGTVFSCSGILSRLGGGMALDGFNLHQTFGTTIDPATGQSDPSFYLGQRSSRSGAASAIHFTGLRQRA